MGEVMIALQFTSFPGFNYPAWFLHIHIAFYTALVQQFKHICNTP